jgi:hypothetical protein
MAAALLAALRASLRDGFASVDAAPTRKDSAPVRKMGRSRIGMVCDPWQWRP